MHERARSKKDKRLKATKTLIFILLNNSALTFAEKGNFITYGWNHHHTHIKHTTYAP